MFSIGLLSKIICGRDCPLVNVLKVLRITGLRILLMYRRIYCKGDKRGGVWKMENFLSIIHYIILGLSLAAPIGPMNIEVLKRGFTEGFISSWLVGLGGLAGDVIILISIFWGFRDLIHYIWIQYLMYMIGTVMLSYLGITSITAAFNRKQSPTDFNRGISRNAFFTGFTISIANPISLIFWFGVYGTSLQVLISTHSLLFSIICSFSIIVGLFLWNINLVLTVYFSKRILNDKVMRGITLIAGVTLVCFSMQFLIQLVKLIPWY
jgi:threonine/homoserine/homoserine lactone efflux protein